MGCDIHLYVEKRIYGPGGKEKHPDKKGVWVLADKLKVDESSVLHPNESYFDYEIEKCFQGRHYGLFGFLAGVRVPKFQIFKRRGMPEDSCREIRLREIKWGVDGHSHSHIDLKELKEEFSEEKTLKIEGKMFKSQYDKLKKTIDEGNPNWELFKVFEKDKEDDSLIDYSFDIPRCYIFSDFMKKVINYMEKIKKDSYYGLTDEDLRIVFWFDN